MNKKPFFRAAIDNPDSVSARQLAHAQSLLALKARQFSKIEEFGIDGVVALLADGHTHTEIAKTIGCHQGAVSMWINRQVGDAAVALNAAKKCSAPANMDRALAALNSADPTIPGACSLAIQASKHFQLRAALADRRGYSERLLPQDLAQASQPTVIPSFTVNVYPQDKPKNTLTISQSEDVPDADLI